MLPVFGCSAIVLPRGHAEAARIYNDIPEGWSKVTRPGANSRGPPRDQPAFWRGVRRRRPWYPSDGLRKRIYPGRAIDLWNRGNEVRKLIMWNLVTLDGFFEGPKSWDLDWHDTVWGEELEQYSIEQSSSTGALLFGRVTYEGMASYWPSQKGAIADFMNTIPKVVFSRTLEEADWNNTTLVKDNVIDEVRKLKKQPGKTLFVFGSADLSATLLEHGLSDER